MSANPDFVAQTDANYTTVRMYTAFDPYFYTVDNRPLQDLETNIKAARTGGGDAARRAALMGSINLSAVMADIFSVSNTSSAIRTASGLKISNPSTNVIRVSPGAVYEARNMSLTVSDNLMKQAVITKNTDFTVNPITSAGYSVVYTIEGQYYDLTSSNMTSTSLPGLDSTNIYLPSNLIQGELRLTIVIGAAALTGTQLPATTTTGNFPIYNLTFTNGTTQPKVTAHSNAPYLKGFSKHSTPVVLPSGGATSTFANEMPVMTFADAFITGVHLPITDNIKSLNPYLPIKLKLTIASSVASNSVAMRLRYKGYQANEVYTNSLTTGTVEAITIGATNALQTYTTAIAIIPNTEFAGFVNNVWVINKEKLNIILERIGTDAVNDTNTGLVSLFGVVLFQ